MSDARPTIAIRAAQDADSAGITALLEAQLGEHGITADDGRVATTLGGILAHPERGAILLAERVGDPPRASPVVGVALLSFLWVLEHGGRGVWLDELYVVPEMRSQGVGRRLLQAAIERAASSGARALDLEVEDGHERAARLYLREGFVAHSRRRFFRALHHSPLRSDEAAQPANSASPAALLPPYDGGCLCGAVRFRLTAPPVDAGYCHCRLCQRAHGAPVVAWATVRAADFALTAGLPAERASSATGIRSFCGTCGTPLGFRASRADAPTLDVPIACLDDPRTIRPTYHIWTASQIPWFEVDDLLARHRDAGEDLS